MVNKINELIKMQRELFQETVLWGDFLDDPSIANLKSIIEPSFKENGYVVLTLLLQATRQIKLRLCDFLVEEAIVGTPRTLGRAREVLCSIGYSDRLENLVVKAVHEVITKWEHDIICQDYYLRNAAQLYYELNYKETLNSFLEESCKDNVNSDIREIYDDYK